MLHLSHLGIAHEIDSSTASETILIVGSESTIPKVVDLVAIQIFMDLSIPHPCTTNRHTHQDEYCETGFNEND